MADQNQDVNLRIRATDYGKKTTDQVVKSLKDLAKAQDAQVEAAQRGTAAAKDLAKGYDDIENAAKALVGQRSIIDVFERQNAALRETEALLEQTRKAQSDYANSLTSGAKLTKDQREQTARLAKAVSDAQRAYDGIQRSIATTGDKMAKLGIDTRNTASAQATINQALTEANIALERQENALTGLDAAAARHNAMIADEAALERQRAADMIFSNAQRIQSEKMLAKAQADAAAFGPTRADAARGQQQLIAELNTRVQLAQRIEAETQARRAQTQAVLAAADAAERSARASGATARGGAVGAAPANLAGTLQDMQQPGAAALRTVGGLDASIAQLGQTVSAINGPIRNYRDLLQQATAAQRALVDAAGRIDAFRNQEAAVRAARIEYTRAEQEVHGLIAELRSGAAGEGIDTRMARAQATLRGAATELGRLTTAAHTSEQALRAAGVDTANLAQQEQHLVAQSTAATASVNQLTAAYQRYGAATTSATNGARQTLSYAQRMRGELLSLASGFVGIYATVNLATKALDAYKTNQAVTSRLLIANGGDAKAAGDDFKYLQIQADRIGFSFSEVAPAFTKFAIAAKSANFTTQQTRFVFENVAEAGVKARLSTEELGGVFKAFEQIMSKGTVQAEELRGQLGDRLPGAFQIAARAAGMTVEEYSKAIELGQIGAEQVIGIARELGKTYGVASKGADTLLEAQARFDNAAQRFLTSTAEGGFVEAYTNFLAKMTELMGSGTGDKLASVLSAGFSSVINVIITVADNMDLLKAALIGLIGVKFIGWLTSLPALFTAVSGAIIGPTGAVAAITAFSGVMTTLAGSGVVGFLVAVAGGFAAIAAAGISAYMATSSIVDYFNNKQRAAVQKTIRDSDKAVADAQRAADLRDAARGTAKEAEAQAHYEKMRNLAVAAVKAQEKAVADAKAGGLDMKGVKPGQFAAGTPDPGESGFGLADVAKTAKAGEKDMQKLEQKRREVQLAGAKKDLKERLALVNAEYDDRRKLVMSTSNDALEQATKLAQIEKEANYAMAAERIKFNQEAQKEGETAGAKRVKVAQDVANKLQAAEDALRSKRADAEADKVPFEKRSEAAVTKEVDKLQKLMDETEKLTGAEKERFQIKIDELKSLTAEYTDQDKSREEAIRLEKQLNDLLEIQKAKKEAIAAKFAGDPNAALAETNKVTAEMGPQIEALGNKTLGFVESVKKLLDPVAYAKTVATVGQVVAQNGVKAQTAQANLIAGQARMNALIEQRAAGEAAIRQQRQLDLIGSEEEARRLNENALKYKQGILDSTASLLAFAEAARAAGVINEEQLLRIRDMVNGVATGTKDAIKNFNDLDMVIASTILQNGVTAFESLASAMGQVITGQKSMADGFRAAGQAAAQFFAGILRDIALYIIKQQILKAMGAFFGPASGIGAAAMSMAAGAKHNGGSVGMAPPTFSRNVSPSIFAGAPKFHNGGLPGLRPDEVPIIAQKGEEVITRDDPRNVLNGGTGSGNTAGIRVVIVDDKSKVPQAMASSEGETVIVQAIKNNLPTVKAMLR